VSSVARSGSRLHLRIEKRRLSFSRWRERCVLVAEGGQWWGVRYDATHKGCVVLEHVTIYRWVQRFTPLLAEAARPCRLKQDLSATVIIAGHAFVQNVRRGHYELGAEEPVIRRVVVAFDELALAI